jgi:toxin CcdB
VVIRRFDVFRNPESRSVKTFPYLLVLQSELLDGLLTVVVVPLLRRATLAGAQAQRLNPGLIVEGEMVYMLTQQIGSVATKSLSKHVTNLDSERMVITQALDLLFSGI